MSNLDVFHKSLQKSNKMFGFSNIARNCLIQQVIRKHYKFVVSSTFMELQNLYKDSP